MSYRTAILPHDFRKPAILLCAKLQQVSKPPCWITAIKIKLQSLKCVIQLEGREPLCARWIQLDHFLIHLSCVDFIEGSNLTALIKRTENRANTGRRFHPCGRMFAALCLVKMSPPSPPPSPPLSPPPPDVKACSVKVIDHVWCECQD